MITLLMLVGLAFAAPKMNDREIHLKYFKQVYGENFENLKDLKFWYGYKHTAPTPAPPRGVSGGSVEHWKIITDKRHSYLPQSQQIEKVCNLSSDKKTIKDCINYIVKRFGRNEYFAPVYAKPSLKSELIGFFHPTRGGIAYKGEVLGLGPYHPETDVGDSESSWEPFLSPILDYQLIKEKEVSREWMRIPTMGRPGEAWVTTTDLEGPMPILDLQLRNVLTKGKDIEGLGLVQLSKNRLLNDSCYMGVEKGHVLFKQFIFRMNWEKSLRRNSGNQYFRSINEKGPEIDAAERELKDPVVLEYLEKYKSYPPLVFRLPLIDFFLGLGNQFRDESQVAMSQGEVERNCDYRSELFYKKIPRDTIIAFADRFGGALNGMTFGNPYKDYEANDDKFSKALRGENLVEPFSIYIHQIHTGEK